MYAQCPECLTFFHLKPSHLKAANGRVRCSRCKHVFNALETLRDELTPEEIAAVEEAKRREPKPDAPLLNEEYVGDLFDGLEYTRNEELGLGEPESVDTRDAEESAELQSAHGGIFAERESQSDQLGAPVREFPDFDRPARRPRRHRLLFAAGNLLLIFLMVAQLAHWQRDRLLADPELGPHVARAYRALGLKLEPPRDLAKMKVSRSAVSSHPDHPQALELTAQLENTANMPQPWPELRVDLQDRWGETVGARYFSAGEYLRKPEAAEKPMAPNARYAVSLAILDPGNNAVGFQVEACFSSGPADARRHLCSTYASTP